MAFKLIVSDTVTVPVEGRLPDDTGRAVPFTFSLVAKRLPASGLRQAIDANDATVPEFLTGLVQGWSGVLGDDGKEVPFSPAGLAALFDIVGMAQLCFQAYLQACGARGKEKN
jgi:hypothetical protein